MTELNVAAAPWRAGVIQDFARSELFDRTFEEGMQLVEETAAYLDGAGRHDSKILSRNAALAYASESMRLTTRLMQVASWLLVQRAVKEGEMAAEAACADNYRLGLESGEPAPVEDLPFGLVNLLQRSERLYERVRHLDKRMYVEAAQVEAPRPVQAHFDRLSAAFGI
jgi:regulator of CtrA degradation